MRSVPGLPWFVPNLLLLRDVASDEEEEIEDDVALLEREEEEHMALLLRRDGTDDVEDAETILCATVNCLASDCCTRPFHC